MKKTVGPLLKTCLEIGPVMVFFLCFFLIKDEKYNIAGNVYDGFIVVTALFIPLVIFSTAILWYLSGQISRMQVLTAIFVTIFGVMSVWFNDERFFKMKPSILYAVFGVIILFGVARGRSYIKFFMGNELNLSERGWQILTRRFGVFFLLLAVLNEIIWRNFSTEFWVSFKTFGIPVLMLCFFASQIPLFNKLKN